MTKGVIVCIDDDKMVLVSLRDQLSRIVKDKYEIELAESGEEALELLNEIKASSQKIPLVICDQMLSGMRGDEVLIRIHAEYPDTRTILLTGQPNLQGVLQAVNQANLYRYISKPWEETDLSLTVKEALRSYHSDRKLQQQNVRLRQINRLLQQEITKRQGIEQQLRYENLHDSLTGLANRTLILRTLHQSIERARNSDNCLFAVLFVDLERFKAINDTLGHTIGDKLLIAVARRLERIVRNTDTVARIGGDEFVILIEPIKETGDAVLVAERICEEFSSPFWIEEQEVSAFPNVGITFSTQAYQQPSQVLRDADIAMYFSRQKRTPGYEVFQPLMHSKTIERLNIERDLIHALRNEELRVYYQPIITLKNLQIVGFEALVRWQHPTRGLVSPCQFIPIAERTELIVDIGEWVMKTACQQMKNWSLQFPDRSLKISVNISLKQLKDPDLMAKIDRILVGTGWDSHKLQLEITESMLMDDVDDLLKIFAQLATRKIQLSIDDFGTGYSSLSYLHQFPVKYLKVDRSFIKNIYTHSESKKITELIVMLAHNLDMEVIAEGVETTQQIECLRPFNCEYVQGYLFSAPVPVEAATKLISEI
ncbi:putative bifunctional diguanylate cyclase/phosphodiesterase [Merismopedia glauca]|uniref:Diguanylate cyclase n=1 Tax=Merismopedia glauca CCAP 1448/3 TaxID=1296344 RepID=A0A2T1BYN3_9CYAN|nr:EAL domain-containing protein [Merismopedia glauca]PSB00983.1 diguanylate cyclase [Merismopedia glauca CCAP 1448/3]